MSPDLGLVLMAIVVIIGCIMMYRNYLTYNVRIRANKVVSHKAKKWIDDHVSDGKGNRWIEFYDKHESYGSYDRMLFDIRKWKYEQFFPGLDEFTLEDE